MISAISNSNFFYKKVDNPSASEIPFSLYQDFSSDNKLLSSVKVYQKTSKLPEQDYKHHESFKDLCLCIAKQRNPSCSSKEVNEASFSGVNRNELETEVTLSPSLKKLFNLSQATDEKIKKLFTIRSLYKYNSEFNGHSYTDKQGNLVKIQTATSSSSDRKSPSTQNLSVLTLDNQNLLYTGRPDTYEKAEEQAHFVLSHKLGIPLLKTVDPTAKVSQEMPSWAVDQPGVLWNPRTKSLEVPYVVYSLMSDSNLLSFFYSSSNSSENNEKLLLKQEQQALEALAKHSVYAKDWEGNVFKIAYKPILFSQGFNASAAALKGISQEGSVSPLVMKQGWNSLLKILGKYPQKVQKLEYHIQTLNRYFQEQKYLDPVELFFHMHILLAELNQEHEVLPIVLHCKSSTDRTGIAAAMLTALKQYRKMQLPIPQDPKKWISDPKFKELFVLNWIPMWHQRSKFSRDIEGVSFGSGLFQNPILLECLPQRYLTNSFQYPSWWGKVGLLTIFNLIGSLSEVSSRALLLGQAFSSKRNPESATTVFRKSLLEQSRPSFCPTVQVNEKGLRFKSKTSHPPSPLEKEEKSFDSRPKKS